MNLSDTPIASARTSRKPRARDAAATQRRLLAAAEGEFAAQGYQGARLRNIASQAGVQPALIHHYFVDKEGLYRAMLDAALGESSSQSWQILDREGTLDELIERFVRMLLAFNEKHQNLLAILRHEARAGSPASDVTRQVVHTQVTPLVAAVSAYLQRLRDSGEVRADCDLDELIMMALALCSYPFMERPFLEVCMPSRLITDEASRAAREAKICEAIARIARPDRAPR